MQKNKGVTEDHKTFHHHNRDELDGREKKFQLEASGIAASSSV